MQFCKIKGNYTNNKKTIQLLVIIRTFANNHFKYDTNNYYI